MRVVLSFCMPSLKSYPALSQCKGFTIYSNLMNSTVMCRFLDVIKKVNIIVIGCITFDLDIYLIKLRPL